jgi:hypothetical protein
MTRRLPATPAPGPLESFAQKFGDLFAKLNQRESFRRYLEGLLLPMERNKTLTALANTEPVVGAQHASAQKLQWFLSESSWDPEAINQRRVELLKQSPGTAPTAEGVLVIDETGDRKWGDRTAHIGRQYLGSVGKVDNGVVTVHSLWADERRYYPLQVEPFTPARWFGRGKNDPAYRTKPQIALKLVERAMEEGLPFRAVVADSLYGESQLFVEGLEALRLGYVLALRPSHSWWHPQGQIGSVEELARSQPWTEQAPGAWRKVIRHFRDGREEDWWVLEGKAGPYGPDKPQRLLVVTTDPATLPELSTWYLASNLPKPRSQRARGSMFPTANQAEIVRLFGLRTWVEQSYKQVKNSLGWAQYQVRSDLAMRRHWQLVCCAFSFCWWALGPDENGKVGLQASQQPAGQAVASDGEKKTRPRQSTTGPGNLAPGATQSEGVARTLDHATTLLGSVVEQAPTASGAEVA